MVKHFLDLHSEHSVLHLTSGALFVLMSLNELFVAPHTALLSDGVSLHNTRPWSAGQDAVTVQPNGDSKKKKKAFLQHLNQLLMSDSWRQQSLSVKDQPRDYRNLIILRVYNGGT